MKLYEDYSQSPDGWNITSTLKLEDDGRFQFEETWTDYTNATMGVLVEGIWRREVGAVTLHPLRVEGSVGSWLTGQERIGIQHGDTLDFGGRLILRVPPQREQDFPIRNTGTDPMTVVLEPWGTRHEIAPGERVRVVASGPGGMGSLEVVRGKEKVVVYGWSGSRVAVVREQEKTIDANTARPHEDEAVKPNIKSPDAPTYSARVAKQEFAMFEPLKPSPELAERIRQWVDDLPTEGMQNWIGRLCKEHGSIPLHSTPIYLWALRSDGQLLSIDHESAARRAELENDPVTAYAALIQGARKYQELSEMLTHIPVELLQCAVCGGTGWMKSQPHAQVADFCQHCSGMGWHAPMT